MAGFLGVKDLEQRRRALAAESEIYRQSLLLQTMNVRLSAVQTRKRLVASARPWLITLAPLGAIFSSFQNRAIDRGKRRRKRSLLGNAMLMFRLYRRFGPVLQPWLAQVSIALRKRMAAAPPENAPSSTPIL